MTRGNSKRYSIGLKEYMFYTSKRSKLNTQKEESKDKRWQEIVKAAVSEEELGINKYY
jgi:hypothetical protein